MTADFPKERIHVFIYGNVQGITFRYFLKRNADDLELTGWVKNKDNNCVEAVFEGKRARITRIRKFCKLGPNLARIKEVKIIKEEPENIERFSIIR